MPSKLLINFSLFIQDISLSTINGMRSCKCQYKSQFLQTNLYYLQWYTCLLKCPYCCDTGRVSPFGWTSLLYFIENLAISESYSLIFTLPLWCFCGWFSMLKFYTNLFPASLTKQSTQLEIMKGLSWCSFTCWDGLMFFGSKLGCDF